MTLREPDRQIIYDIGCNDGVDLPCYTKAQ